MSYLEKLKTQKSHHEALSKVPKVEKPKKTHNPPTAKTAKRPYDSFDSTPNGLISGKKQDIAFNILDQLLGGGRTTSMYTWRQKCRAAGVGELDMWRARLEIEAMDLATFDGGTIKLKTG